MVLATSASQDRHVSGMTQRWVGLANAGPISEHHSGSLLEAAQAAAFGISANPPTFVW
jgi:hypothetical protein